MDLQLKSGPFLLRSIFVPSTAQKMKFSIKYFSVNGKLHFLCSVPPFRFQFYQWTNRYLNKRKSKLYQEVICYKKSSHRSCSSKNCALKNFPKSQENVCVRPLLGNCSNITVAILHVAEPYLWKTQELLFPLQQWGRSLLTE